MALTREQFQKLRDKGLSVDQIISFEKGETPADLKATKQTNQAMAGNQFDQEKPTSFLGKARDFAVNLIGGGKLAEGAGKAIASSAVLKSISETQKTTTDMQQKLIQTIKLRKSEGKDTTRLENALKSSLNSSKLLTDASSDFAESLPTTKEIVGSTLRLAGTFAAGSLAGGVATKLSPYAGKVGALGKFVPGLGKVVNTTGGASSLVGLSKATNFASGALRGAGAGALSGAGIGAIQGVGVGMEENKSAKDIALSGAIGAGGGAIVGGVLGTITGGITGGLRGKRIANEEFAKDFVSPKQTPKLRAEAIYQGRLKDPTTFEKAQIEYSKRDEALAKSVEDVVSRNAKLSENVDAVRYKINQTNLGVKDYITKNKVPFNTNQIKTVLDNGKEDLKLIFASDTNAEKTYNAVSDAFMKHIGKKDTLGLFEARQTFDKIPAIKKLLDSEALGENTRKEIVLAVRRAANEYIAEKLPQGNLYRANLLNESNMIEALGNIAEKSQSIIGKNKLQLLTQQYPILKWLVGGLAAGAVGAAGVGVGSTIIGSSD